MVYKHPYYYYCTEFYGRLSKLISRFDRHVKDTYALTVRVFDSGSPPLHSDTLVTVTVIEESSFPPLVTPLSVTVTTYGDEFAGGVIGTHRRGYNTRHMLITPLITLLLIYLGISIGNEFVKLKII